MGHLPEATYSDGMSTDLALRIGRGMGFWGPGYAFRWIAVLMFLAFLALLAVGVALLWRRGVGGTGGTRLEDEALATIRMRYARGEMTSEEFLKANEDLGGSPPQPPPPAA